MGNLVELPSRRALNRPEQTAYKFPFDGEAVGPSLTYAAEDRRGLR